jgi:mannosyltransferase OCH1-like enzyme
MIPKIIHYCWISDESNMSQKTKECIESWHKYMPNYQFINWNDKNFDWNVCGFTKHCRGNNIYAFCSDYVRFWALYNYGGIYLDTDVMVYKSFDKLLGNRNFFTREHIYNCGNLEAAIIGAEKGMPLFKKIIDYYNNTSKFPPDNAVIAPWVLLDNIVKNNYILNEIDDINNMDNNDNIINVLNCHKFFDSSNLSSDTFANHLFNNQLYNDSFNIIHDDTI